MENKDSDPVETLKVTEEGHILIENHTYRKN